MEEKKVNKKQMVGIVVSDKMNKTIVVSVEQLKQHPIYKKYIRRNVRFKAHDEKELAKVGDKVRIIECRPISKEKSFRLAEIINKS